MRSCIVLGAGRSGTSLVAGSLAAAGYHMGESLYKPRPSNPKGFFESPVINGINDELLESAVAFRGRLLTRFMPSVRPGPGQGWLARVPLHATLTAASGLRQRIAMVCTHHPFCYKDPRFCYTLPVWRPYLGDAVYLCVFRHPAATAASILRECRDQSYLRTLRMSFSRALEVWRLMYTHVLRMHADTGEWVFLHFDQMIDGSAADRIERATGARVDRAFAAPELRRSFARRRVPADAVGLYHELCDRAEFRAG